MNKKTVVSKSINRFNWNITIRWKKLIVCLAMLLCAQPMLGQDSVGARQEGWPEINLYYNFNDRLRMLVMYSATRLRTSEFTDGGLGIYLDYFSFGSLRKKFKIQPIDSTKRYYLWIRTGYYYSSTPPNSKEPIKEHTFATDANSRYHLPEDILLTHKNRFDWRFVNGDFQPRYRTRLTVEKEFHTKYLYVIPYFYGEYFANMYSGSANRLRLCVGYELRVTAHIIVENYFLYQFRNGEAIDAVKAVGFVAKFFFSGKDTRWLFSKKSKKDSDQQ